MSCLVIGLLSLVTAGQVATNLAEIRQLARAAKPGTTIAIAPGEYNGGLWLEDIHGAKGKPITICAKDPKNPPRLIGGSGVHLSKVSHLVLKDIEIARVSANGLNVDDGGNLTTPAHHVRLENITVTDTPKGNNDGIKLSGLNDFQVVNCTVERWGGSAVDMVGCHDGLIEGCLFRSGGDTGVQMKGGTGRIAIRKSAFAYAGQRGVNLGGSTGLQFFRPPLSAIPSGSRAEASDLLVEGCTFAGGVAAVAFVGVDRALVRKNLIYNPERWAIRILQETREPGFVKCRNGVFAENVVVFENSWASGGVNVGDQTDPGTFQFDRNYWFCSDDVKKSKPFLPTAEKGGVYGVDPMVTIDGEGRLNFAPDSPLRKLGFDFGSPGHR